MRRKRRAEVASTTEKLCACFAFEQELRQVAASLCSTLLLANSFVPACFAQSNNVSKQSSVLAPNTVAPISPPPVAPPISTRIPAKISVPPVNTSTLNGAAAPGSLLDKGPFNPSNLPVITPWKPQIEAPAKPSIDATSKSPGTAPSKSLVDTGSKPPVGSVSKPPVSAHPAAGASSFTPFNSSPSATKSTGGSASAPVKSAPLPAHAPGAASPASGASSATPLLKPQVPKIAEPAPAPDINKAPAGSPGSAPGAGATTNANTEEKYPAIAHLEILTFGETHPAMAISDRLANLESTVFKETHPTDSLFSRTERLQKVLVGSEGPTPYESPQYRPPDLPSYARVPPATPAQDQPNTGWTEPPRSPVPTGNPGESQYSYFDEIAVLPENRVVVNSQQLQDYFLEMVNNERRKVGSPPLEIDQIAEKLATEHVTQLAERAQISHSNTRGENPDRRYTLLGGTDAVTESLVSLKNSELGSRRLYRGAAAKLLRVLMSHQDDRDALTSRDTTHVGFAAEWTADHSRLIACAELVSKHAIIHPVPDKAHIDEKIDVKGVMTPPYQFVRVTLAWEGGNSNLASVADESDEALPYFPPLDYIAYQKRAESGGHDKAIMILKGVGIAAAIAGGVFMPPVALAAPLIAVSGSGSGEHKPASEIPVKGGVKLEGSVFETKVPLSNEGKDGLYYLTVWGAEGQGSKPVPISRRVIYVSGGKEDSAQTTTSSDTGEITSPPASKKDEKRTKNAKKAKKNKNATPSS